MKPVAPSTLPPRSQRECCYAAALDENATYCGECGKPLIRCMAAEECGGLLDDSGLCTICVAPHLQIDAGALTAARVGGAVALPVSIANLSAVGRPLFVTALWSREGNGPWREESLSWEKLGSGESRPATITVNEITRSGAHGVQILVAVASRWRWRQEAFAFSSQLSLSVEDNASENGPVVNIGGESAGHGNLVYISGKTDKDNGLTRATEALQLRMVRAEKEERRLGLRGIDENHWVPRNAEIAWQGFDKPEAPAKGPILTTDGVLAAGRSRTRKQDGLGDIRLLVPAEGGAADEELSRLISRRHFELYIESDRLTLRITGSGGIRVNGTAFGEGKTVILNDGDLISPIVAAPDAMTLKVNFQSEYGRVGRIVFSRHPSNA